MSKNPFGLPESASERLIREEAERARRARDLMGSSVVQEAIRQARGYGTIAETTRGGYRRHALMTEIEWGATFTAAREALRFVQEQRQSPQHLASGPWASSIQETARDIARDQTSLREQQRAFGSTLVEAAEIYRTQRTAVEAAIQTGAASAQYRDFISELLPRMQLYGAIAERMRWIDVTTLRASHELDETIASDIASVVIEVRDIAEAIAGSDDDAESANLFGRLADAILGLYTRFGENTVLNLEKMGLIDITNLSLAILGVLLSVQTPAENPQTQAALVEINQKISHVQAEQQRYVIRKAERDQAYLAGKPRAQLSRAAIFRNKPSREGHVVLHAPAGMEVAITEVQGRWQFVRYRDPLSTELASAWVYATAVETLSVAGE